MTAKLKMGKAAGVDEIHCELFKYGWERMLVSCIVHRGRSTLPKTYFLCTSEPLD